MAATTLFELNHVTEMTGFAANITGILKGNLSLEALLGYRYRPFVECVVLIVIYVIIFITGVIGNVITCVVIARNSYMQTATNYYLFSLAVSDLLTLTFGTFKCIFNYNYK